MDINGIPYGYTCSKKSRIFSPFDTPNHHADWPSQSGSPTQGILKHFSIETEHNFRPILFYKVDPHWIVNTVNSPMFDA